MKTNGRTLDHKINPRPFLDWLMFVEDEAKSRASLRDRSPHFAFFPEFQGASYLKRCDVLCQRNLQEQLNTSAYVIASPRDGVNTGGYADMSVLTSLKMFVTSFAGHNAAEAV